MLMAAVVRATQVWVITGDKQETAINIAISCKLILHPDKLMICNADSVESALRRCRTWESSILCKCVAGGGIDSCAGSWPSIAGVVPLKSNGASFALAVLTRSDVPSGICC